MTRMTKSAILRKMGEGEESDLEAITVPEEEDQARAAILGFPALKNFDQQ